jgi:AraC-like DNA-binding protein
VPSRPIVVPQPLLQEGAAPGNLAHPANRLMWITPDRVLYVGLLGSMSTRTMGGWLIYVSLGAPMRVALERGGQPGAWERTELAVIPPYMPHRVESDDRMIASVTLEPESIDPDHLPQFLQGPAGARDDEALCRQIRQAHAWLRLHGQDHALPPEGFDERVLGQTLVARHIEPRVRRVLDRMRADPEITLSAAEGAASVGLSCSRFLHLFKEQAGASFRNVRTWKRARSLLHHVNRPANLAHMALDRGYPDSTHFSHSIRQIYGLTPRDLFAGSRRLKLLGQSTQGATAGHGGDRHYS